MKAPGAAVLRATAARPPVCACAAVVRVSGPSSVCAPAASSPRVCGSARSHAHRSAGCCASRAPARSYQRRDLSAESRFEPRNYLRSLVGVGSVRAGQAIFELTPASARRSGLGPRARSSRARTHVGDRHEE